MKRILIIGHSHLMALQKAKTLDDTFDLFAIPNKGEKAIYEIDCSHYCSAVLSIRGNYHNVFGLVKLPNPFDFYLPEKVDLPIMPNTQILPFNLLTKVFERDMSVIFNLTKKISHFFKQNGLENLYHIESPPPIASEVIENHPTPFEQKIKEFGVSPIEFRYKLWRLHSKVVRENCEKLDIKFINAPNKSQDSDGYLSEEYCYANATHANALYGALVLNQIRAIHNISLK